MHRKFVAWLSKSWGRTAVCTALFGVLALFGMLPFLVAAGALPVFVALRTDARQGIRAALVGTIVVSGLLLVAGGSVLAATVNAATLFWMPLALGLLLKRYGSLAFVFQIAVLLALVGIGVNYLMLGDADGIWKGEIREASSVLEQQMGLKFDDQQVGALQSFTNWGTLVTLLLLTALCPLFLGRWWQSLLDAPQQFGVEFRQLKLGRYLGTTAILIMLVTGLSKLFGFSVPVVDAWLWIAVVALALQGLAAAHDRKANGKLASGWLTAIYLFLVLPPLMMMMVAILVGLGLADNWRRGEISR